MSHKKPRTNMHCPINEQSDTCGRCWFYVADGMRCPRHGNVAEEVERFNETGKLTLENRMRQRKGLPLLPIRST